MATTSATLSSVRRGAVYACHFSPLRATGAVSACHVSLAAASVSWGCGLRLPGLLVPTERPRPWPW